MVPSEIPSGGKPCVWRPRVVTRMIKSSFPPAPEGGGIVPVNRLPTPCPGEEVSLSQSKEQRRGWALMAPSSLNRLFHQGFTIQMGIIKEHLILWINLVRAKNSLRPPVLLACANGFKHRGWDPLRDCRINLRGHEMIYRTQSVTNKVKSKLFNCELFDNCTCSSL